MAAEPEPEKFVKRRSWGKPRQREKIADVDNMEVDEGQNTLVEPEAHAKGIDLQHPEMMKTEGLVEVLTRMKVPIPVYSDGSPSRERLVYLFRKHVTPRPQRQDYKGRKRRRWGVNMPMEVEPCWDDDWSDASKGGSDWGMPSQRKRKLDDTVITSPPKRPVDVPCNSFSKISVSGIAAPTTTETSTATCPCTATALADSKPSPRVIKIRRFRNSSSSDLGSDLNREDGHGTVGRTIATEQLSVGSSQESDPNVVNGKSRPKSEECEQEKFEEKPVQKITWP